MVNLSPTIRVIRGRNPLTALAVYDSDSTGDLARASLSQYPRVQIIASPDDDHTDY